MALTDDPQGNRDSSLTSLIEFVDDILLAYIDIITREFHTFFDYILYNVVRLCFISTTTISHIYSKRYRLSTFDSFWMTMSTFCSLFCLCQHPFAFMMEPSHRTDSHSRAITKASVWLWIITHYPFSKATSISALWIRIQAAPLMEFLAVVFAIQ